MVGACVEHLALRHSGESVYMSPDPRREKDALRGSGSYLRLCGMSGFLIAP